MATAWRKNNQRARRMVALQNLKKAMFFEKNYRATGKPRTKEEWESRVARDIQILEQRIR